MYPRRVRWSAFVWLSLALGLAACGAPAGEGGLPAAGAAGKGDGCRAGRASHWVRLRAEPSTAGAALATLPAGAALCVLPTAAGGVELGGGRYDTDGDGDTTDEPGSLDAWLEVTYDGRRGFVGAFFVELAGAATQSLIFHVHTTADPTLIGALSARGDALLVVGPAEQQQLAAQPSDEARSALLAQLIGQRMAAVEARAPAAITFVLSGHSSGSHFWGELGTLGHWSLPDVVRAHPVFASRVRHLVLLGCNAGRPAWMDLWRKAFPELVSVAGFSGTGPLGAQAYSFLTQTHARVRTFDAAVQHPAALAEQLLLAPTARVRASAFKIVRNVAGAPRYGSWSVNSLTNSIEAFRVSRAAYEAYLAARDAAHADPPADTQSEVLYEQPTPRMHYHALQGLANALLLRPDLTAIEPYLQSWLLADFGTLDVDALLAQVLPRLDQSVRLVFFRLCKRRWLQDTERVGAAPSKRELIASWLAAPERLAALRAAWASALGRSAPGAVTIPMLEALDRRQTIDLVEALEALLPADPLLQRLRRALIELTSEELPIRYV